MSMNTNLIADLGLTVAATGLSAAIAELLFRVKRRLRGKSDKEQNVDAIGEALSNEREGRAAAVAEVLATEAMGDNPTPERFQEILQSVLVNIDRRSPAVSPAEQLIHSYHGQALGQAQVQFWFSVIAALVGFGWILYAGSSIQPENLATISKTFPGIVMDAVAFLFFRQATETRQRATELYDRLRKDKQMAESSAIVTSIEDTRLRSAVKAQLALHMSGLEPKPIDLGAFLSAPAASATLTFDPTADERLKRQ